MKATANLLAFLAIGLICSHSAWGGQPSTSYECRSSVVKQEVVYKTIDGIQLKLHVFRPKDAAPDQRLPAIVFFFGGGWNRAAKMSRSARGPMPCCSSTPSTTTARTATATPA